MDGIFCTSCQHRYPEERMVRAPSDNGRQMLWRCRACQERRQNTKTGLKQKKEK